MRIKRVDLARKVRGKNVKETSLKLIQSERGAKILNREKPWYKGKSCKAVKTTVRGK